MGFLRRLWAAWARLSSAADTFAISLEEANTRFRQRLGLDDDDGDDVAALPSRVAVPGLPAPSTPVEEVAAATNGRRKKS